MKLNAADWTAYTLAIIGGLNWGMVGLFNFDLVASLFGEGSLLSRIIYTLVGLSAVYLIATATKFAHHEQGEGAMHHGSMHHSRM